MTGALVATVQMEGVWAVAKTLKLIDAGGLQVAALYSRRTGHESPKIRAAKAKASSDAQRRMNRIYSYQKLELMLAASFPRPGSAMVCAATFDDAHMPRSRKEAQLRFKYFLKLLRAERKAAGLPEPVVFWAPEILSSDSGRWHFHFVLDNTGQDLEIIRRCWIYGSEIEADKLRRPDRQHRPAWMDEVDSRAGDEPDNVYKALAIYMTKELRECQEYDSKPGLHGWSCTRNAKKPEIETLTVEDDYDLTPPEGSEVLYDRREATQYAGWHVIKYHYDGSRYPAPPRARRRRRRSV